MNFSLMPRNETSPEAEAYFKVAELDAADMLTFYRQLDNGYDAFTVTEARGDIVKVNPSEELTLQAREYTYFFVFNSGPQTAFTISYAGAAGLLGALSVSVALSTYLF